MKTIIQTAGLVMMCSVFVFQAYTILTEPETQADKLFKQYADFRIWSNKAQRSFLGGSTMLEFPSSEFVKPYKRQATYMMAYMNLLGALGLVIGETTMGIPLLLVHLMQSFLKNNPFPLHPTADQASYDNKMRCFLIDMVLACGILIVMLDQHPLVSTKKSSKVLKKTE